MEMTKFKYHRTYGWYYVENISKKNEEKSIKRNERRKDKIWESGPQEK